MERPVDGTRFRKTYSFFRQEPRPAVPATYTTVNVTNVMPEQPGSLVYTSLPVAIDTTICASWYNDTTSSVDVNEAYVVSLQNTYESPVGEYWALGTLVLPPSASVVPSLVHSASALGLGITSMQPTYVGPVTVPAGEVLSFSRLRVGNPTVPSRVAAFGWARVPDGYVTTSCVDDAQQDTRCVLYHNTGSSPVTVENVTFIVQRDVSGSNADYWELDLALASAPSASLLSSSTRFGRMEVVSPLTLGSCDVPAGDSLLAQRRMYGTPALTLLPFWVQGHVM